MAIVKSKLLKQLSENYPNFLKRDLEKFTNIIGYVPQSIYLLDDSIKNNITLSFDFEKIDLIHLNKVIAQVNLTKFIATLPNGIETNVGEVGNLLSGGQLQRISIARSLLLKPKILICDESVNMLDAHIKIEILDLLREIQEKMDLSIIFITHDLGIAKNFCNRLLVINSGKIIEEGDSSNIFSNPKSNFTKSLVESSLNLN